MKFDTLLELCEFIAEKLWETPIGWHREVGVREDEDGFTVVFLSEPLTSSTCTTWKPTGDEVFIELEPCGNRNTYCGYADCTCDYDCFVSCTTKYIHDRLSEVGI